MAQDQNQAARQADTSTRDTREEAGQSKTIESYCLDDLISLLLQLEPSDRSELVSLREALNQIASAADPSKAKDLLFRACDTVSAVVNDSAADPSVSLAEAARFIDDALRSQAEPAAGNDPARKSVTPSESDPESELLPGDADQDLLNEFINESREYIQGAEAALLSLETDPDNVEAVNTIFRAFHTIKGTSGFLGLKSISQLAHRAESLLSRVRDKEIRCTGGYADLALRSVDVLKDLLSSVQEALGGKPVARPFGYSELMGVLADPEAAGISGEATDAPDPLSGDRHRIESEEMPHPDGTSAGGEQDPTPSGLSPKPEISLPNGVSPALRSQLRIGCTEAPVESSVRVRTDRLDRLIDMVGELVIAQSMVTQDGIVHQNAHHELLKKVTHAGKIVRELQDLTMSMRMVPLKSAFQKIARLVRDLAHKSGKIVDFISDGEDTEIDRNMVDVVSDPLVHMVRNAIDHGIEAPDAREGLGKPKAGVVHLSAYHAGGNVVLELRDDGKGLDRNKIIAKALAKGLLESDKGLSDSEVFNLIFAPGFSTADKVTDISGRGVGMDVVRRGVETLRGRIEISSKAGKGCTFAIRLPLTLAITDGMLVKVGRERYIIPTVNIYLSFRPDPAALSTIAGRGEMVMLRGELMPIFRLHRLFDIADAVDDPLQGLLVIVGDGMRRCALLVDELLGQQQVVAKTLGAGLGKVHAVSGGAILGDGRVGLILDPEEIIALARTAA